MRFDHSTLRRLLLKTACFGLLIPALSTVRVFAQTAYNEYAGTWLLNPITSNWTCSVFPNLPALVNGCTTTNPGEYGYAYVKPLPVTKFINGASVNKMYFYTEVFGGTHGAGSECVGDNIGLFETPYNHDGVRGSGVIYRGTVRPCDGQYYGLNSAFKDNTLGAIYLTAGVVNVNDPNDNFKRIVFGSSPHNSNEDNGIYFSWSLLVRTNLSNLLLTDVRLAPNPAQAYTWWGFMSFIDKNSPYYFITSPVIVNVLEQIFQYKTGPNTWVSIPIGGTISQTPYYQILRRSMDFSFVRGRWELWVDGTTAQELPPRGGVPPCGFPAHPAPTTTYNNNLTNDASLKTGGATSFYIVSSDFSTTGPWPLYSYGPNNVQDYGTPTSDDIRANPSDYGDDFDFPSRIDLPDGTWGFYTGSSNATVCNYSLASWNFWSGSGIFMTRLVDH